MIDKNNIITQVDTQSTVINNSTTSTSTTAIRTTTNLIKPINKYNNGVNNQRRKNVTFADEVGEELTKSIYYKCDTKCCNDSNVSYHDNNFLKSIDNRTYRSKFQTVKTTSKYNFDIFRNMDTLTRSDYYGLFSNNIALKSFIDCRSSINITVIVNNIAYEKCINIHCTFDNWATKSICPCHYIYKYNRFDIFTCVINYNQYGGKKKLASIKGLSLEFAIEYQVAGQHYWDNNNRKNFVVTF